MHIKIGAFSRMRFQRKRYSMSHLPKDWRFLRSAWIYAHVLTGHPDSATTLVTETLNSIANRNDVVSARRRKRLFFSMMFRAALAQSTASDNSCIDADFVKSFHALSEPGRSALTLLYLRVFPPEELADILGKPIIELADLLQSTRGEISTLMPPVQ